MSEYTSDSYSYTAETALPEVAGTAGLDASLATPGVAAAGGTLAATSILALYEHFRQQGQTFEAQGCAPLDARLKALETVPLLRAALTTTGLAAQDMTKLTAADFDRHLHQAQTRLFEAEGAFLHRQLGAALIELGYEIETSRRPPVEGTRLLRASQAEGTAIVARLTPRAGRVELDLSGFRGDACQAERARLDAALRRRGVKLTTDARQRHQALAGAALSRAADAELGPRQRRAHAPTRQPRQRTRI